MKIVIAPDSFKGTVTAEHAAQALADGWLAARPGDEVVLRPMADGGEGTLAAVAAAHAGAEWHTVPACTGPDGRPVTGTYALLPDKTAVVELANVSGLPLMQRLAPLTATTTGTGQVIAAALDHGAQRLMVCLGGSASTDGGAGLLTALGLRLLDRNGQVLPDGGGALIDAARADTAQLRAAPPGGVELLTDVTNPLLGHSGAAAVYGPQKGAGPAEILRLEAGLSQLASLLGGDASAPGTGAAGGTTYGLTSTWGAAIRPGASAVAEVIGLEAACIGADLVITGEGRFDATSLQGKVVGEVIARAGRVGSTVAVVAGDAAPDTGRQVLTLTKLAGTADAACAQAAHWLYRAGRQLAESVDGLAPPAEGDRGSVIA